MATTDSLKKKTKTSQHKARRSKREVQGLSEVINTLAEKGLISSGCAEVLEKFADVPCPLMERALQESSGSSNKESYLPELRSFAVTLHFCSAKAYNFVRKTFKLPLPPPSAIRRWYSSVPGSPGFSESVFTALKLRVAEAAKSGRKVVCALLLDEMIIKKDVTFEGEQIHGYVAVGDDIHDDFTPVAKYALVIMAVAVNDCWKVPCGYFFIEAMTEQERANLIEDCIRRLHDVGVQVLSLTCDGPSCHFVMMKRLGANLDPYNMESSFQHIV